MKVLVTGYNGFISKNLIKALNKNKTLEILKYGKEHNYIELEEKIKDSDFIFHLAGEVKPKSKDRVFEENNLGLTEKIVELMKKNKKTIPLLMTSTIHAINPKNTYGNTKKEAEKLILDMQNLLKNDIYIYRLPHVFGEGCKPNYNSVLTTWIHNSINNLEIVIFDRKIKMNYVYVQDIVKEFIKCLENNMKTGYCIIDKVYPTTLGEIVDFLNEFKDQKEIKKYNEFKKKLKKTYDYYLGEKK